MQDAARRTEETTAGPGNWETDWCRIMRPSDARRRSSPRPGQPFGNMENRRCRRPPLYPLEPSFDVGEPHLQKGEGGN